MGFSFREVWDSMFKKPDEPAVPLTTKILTYQVTYPASWDTHVNRGLLHGGVAGGLWHHLLEASGYLDNEATVAIFPTDAKVQDLLKIIDQQDMQMTMARNALRDAGIPELSEDGKRSLALDERIGMLASNVDSAHKAKCTLVDRVAELEDEREATLARVAAKLEDVDREAALRGFDTTTFMRLWISATARALGLELARPPRSTCDNPGDGSIPSPGALASPALIEAHQQIKELAAKLAAKNQPAIDATPAAVGGSVPDQSGQKSGQANGSSTEERETSGEATRRVVPIQGVDPGSTPGRSIEPHVADGFLSEIGCTVRDCLDCGCLVPGGPTRCKRCARGLDEEGY